VRAPSVTGFDFDDIDASEYERLRPGYSREAVSWLLDAASLTGGDQVTDLAAGTGKLTRVLAEANLAVIAVEPSTAMHAVLRRSVLGVHSVAAVAEALPFAGDRFACACVAQAFHHMDAQQALGEIYRTVAGGGHLALFWNVYDSRDPLKQAMDEIIDSYIPSWPSAVLGGWRVMLDEDARFEHLESCSFDHPHRLRADDLRSLLLTSSDVASLPPEARRSLVRDVGVLAASLPSEIVIPASTRVDLYLRR
jgi:SAM-dependent methyltransferase